MTQKFESFKNLFEKIVDIFYEIGEDGHLGNVDGQQFMHKEVSDHSAWVEFQTTEEFEKLSDEDKENVKLFTLMMEGA